MTKACFPLMMYVCYGSIVVIHKPRVIKISVILWHQYLNINLPGSLSIEEESLENHYTAHKFFHTEVMCIISAYISSSKATQMLIKKLYRNIHPKGKGNQTQHLLQHLTLGAPISINVEHFLILAPRRSSIQIKIVPYSSLPIRLLSLVFLYQEGNGNPLQSFCLENPRDGKPGGQPSMGSHSQTWLKRLSSSSSNSSSSLSLYYFWNFHCKWLVSPTFTLSLWDHYLISSDFRLTQVKLPTRIVVFSSLYFFLSSPFKLGKWHKKIISRQKENFLITLLISEGKESVI